MKIRYLSTIIFIIVNTLCTESTFAQDPKDYHPIYCDGKWKNRITCYIIPYSENGENLAKIVFTKAAAVWNQALTTAGIDLQIDVVDSQDITDIDMVGNSTSTKNLLAFSDKLTGNTGERFYGAATVMKKEILFTSEYAKFYELKVVHATISLRSWKNDKIMTLTKETGKVSVYSTAVHELGHLLGFYGNHDVPPKSVIARTSDYDYNDYSGNKPLVLGAYDILLLKSMYPKVTATTCLPRP